MMLSTRPTSFNIIRKYLCLVFTLLFCFLLLACQTTTSKDFNPNPLLHDELFPKFSEVEIETEDAVFDIGETATAFVDQQLLRVKGNDQRIKALADGIFNHTTRSLLYQNDANTTASETFEIKAANCLSLVIMTYAMAEHANIGVRFQQVTIPEIWLRRDGYSLLNRHVNLRLYQKSKNNIILYDSKSYQLDFDRRSQSLKLPVTKISKQYVLAMYYNNKGADALIKRNYNTAYAYFRSAINTEHFLVDAWTNLGTLYRRIEQMEFAENAYLQALQINSQDRTSLENLAYLYKQTSRQDEAEKILASIIKQRAENPFYHYMLGDIEYESQNWLQAIKHYKKSVRLNKQQDQFYFSIARSYYQLGDIKNSERYMKLAKRYTHDERQQTLYQRKLDNLATLN
ncbi:MAG: tetratricopeptide (TPR) repeat protein [Enterobacterales bacterium]|jgi:tetratricopeptide (TPR) repeat protein